MDSLLVFSRYTPRIEFRFRTGVILLIWCSRGCSQLQKPIGAQGLEPWQTDSESVVLPLHHAPVTKEYRESIRSSSCIA